MKFNGEPATPRPPLMSTEADRREASPNGGRMVQPHKALASGETPQALSIDVEPPAKDR